ncbi:MAG: hypothetical protein SFW64_00490 [Alphaproteobacteria bacterium]|nr:hypothetical protein [Alphaproteobacteria bacterium]
MQIPDRRGADPLATAQFLRDAAVDVVAHAVHIGLCHHHTDTPHEPLLRDRIFVDDVAFGIKVKLDFPLFDHRIKNGIFLEAALHTVNFIGHDSDGLLMFSAIFYCLQELLTVADRGRLNDFERFKYG